MIASNSNTNAFTPMSSIVTAIPSGVVKEWCIKAPDIFGSVNPIFGECANATRGTYPSDFETICCDGDIVDTTKDLYRAGRGQTVDLKNLICCRVQGPQQGGLMAPYVGSVTACTAGTPIPLASLAATNTKNAQNFLVTFTSASYGSSTTGDFIPTESPYCLWAYTASGMAMTNVTVAAPEITTLSGSASTLGHGGQNSGTTSKTTGTTSSSAAVKQSSTSTSAGSRNKFRKLSSLVLLLSCAVILGHTL